MFISNKIIIPLYIMFIWTFCNIAKRYIAINFDINIILFTLTSLFSASIILILYGRTNKKMIERALKEKFITLYSIFEIMFSISTMILFTYVSATQASLLEQLSTSFAIFSAYAFFNKKPNSFDITGCLLIISSVLYVIGNSENHTISIISYATIITGFFITARALCAEFNPLNFQHLNFQARSKIMGVSLALSILIFSISLLIIKIISLYISTDNKAVLYILDLLPEKSDFLNIKANIAAVFFGIILLSLTRTLYIHFYASQKISTNILLIISAITPLSTWILEFFAMKINLLPKANIHKEDLLWCLIIFLAAIIMSFGKRKKQ